MTPKHGILLAFAGALSLTPDGLFMRLSDLGGGEMLVWRASLSRNNLFPDWICSRRQRDSDKERRA